MLKEYKYVRENGQTFYLFGDADWKSLCHNSDVMDNYAVYLEEDFLGTNLGWGVCRKCGSLSDFVMERNTWKNN